MWDVTWTESNVYPQHRRPTGGFWAVTFLSLDQKMSSLSYVDIFYNAHFRIGAQPSLECCFIFLNLWLFENFLPALHFLLTLFCHYKRKQKTPQVHNGQFHLGELTTQNATISLNLKNLSEWNNRILQNAYKRQIWISQNQIWGINCSISRKYRKTSVAVQNISAAFRIILITHNQERDTNWRMALDLPHKAALAYLMQ